MTYYAQLVRGMGATHYWPMDDTSGANIRAEVGTDLGILDTGNTFFRVAGPTRNGHAGISVGMQLTASGTSGLSNAISLSTSIGQDISMGCWFNQTSGGSGKGIMSDWSGNSGLMLVTGGVDAMLQVWYNGSSITESAGLGLTAWHFAVVTVDSSASRNWRLYNDTLLRVSSTAGANYGAGSSSFEMGAYANNAANTNFTGFLAGAFLIPRAISQVEIRQLYDAATRGRRTPALAG